MLRVSDCRAKLEEIKYLKSKQSGDTETSREYIEYLTRMERGYQKELADALARLSDISE